MTDLNTRLLHAPIDEASFGTLAERGLTARVVTGEEFDPWWQAVSRGFLEPEQTAAKLNEMRADMAGLRKTGVYDVAAAPEDGPAGTIVSWASELSVPGGATVPFLAISDVTVAQTHRRRGIARAMLSGELRVARALGLPVAALTVSEATLYGRYGFGNAANSATVVIDTARAGWIGPEPDGAFRFIAREGFARLAPALHERVRSQQAGEVIVPESRWRRFVGLGEKAKDGDRIRVVSWTRTGGELEGLLAYSVDENESDFARSSATVQYLLAATDDAYAALWRFLLELDLVSQVTARELAVDEPVLWMLRDARAAKVTVHDLHYLRILDVPAMLAARAYPAAGELVLEVTDPLEIASGRYLLRAAQDGSARVEALGDGAPPTGVPVVRLGIVELSSVLLGGIPVASLATAGRISGDGVALAARLFFWPRAPRLSFWY